MEATVKRWKDEVDKKGEWFEYEVGNDGRVKAVKCRLCTKYEHKLKWNRNFSNVFISGATAVKKDNVKKHAVSTKHITATQRNWSCRFATQTHILHCKMLKMLCKICFAEQNNCYAKFQTAIQTYIMYSTNCSAKKNY